MVKRRVVKDDCFDDWNEPAELRDQLASFQVMLTMLVWMFLTRIPIELVWSNTARMAKHLIS